MTSALLVESPVEMIEGETITYSIVWKGASSLSSSSAKVWKEGTDYTATAMPSGSDSTSGNVQTLKPLTSAVGVDGGKKYVVTIQCTVDGNVERRRVVVNILKESAEA